MNIKDFIAGKKITEEDIARLKKNRKNNPYMTSLDFETADSGKIISYVLNKGKIPNSKLMQAGPKTERSERTGHRKNMDKFKN